MVDTNVFLLQPLMPPFLIPERKYEKRHKFRLHLKIIKFNAVENHSNEVAVVGQAGLETPDII